MSGARGALGLIDHSWAALTDALEASLTGLDPHASPAAANLRRAAWGTDEREISLPRLAALAIGLGGSISIDLSALHPQTIFPDQVGQVLLNLLLLAAESLPQGGSIRLAGSADDLFIRIGGPSAAWPAGTAVCVVDRFEAESALLDGRNRQMAVTTALAHASGIRLSALIAPGRQADPAILRLGG